MTGKTDKALRDSIERMSRFDEILIEHPRLGKIRDKIHWLLADTGGVVAVNEAPSRCGQSASDQEQGALGPSDRRPQRGDEEHLDRQGDRRDQR